MRSPHRPHRTRPWSNAGPSRGRPRQPLASEGAGVIREPTLIGLEAVPVDVALMHARHHELPVRPGNLDDTGATIGPVACARAAIRECAGVAWIVQNLQDARMLRWRPQEFALVDPVSSRRGNMRPCSRKKRTVWTALPVRSNVSKTSVGRAAPACRDQGRV